MKDNESEPIHLLLGEISRSLASNSREFKNSEALHEFCERCLCQSHDKNARHTVTQWMKEIKDRATKKTLFDFINSKWPAPIIALEFKTPKPDRSEDYPKDEAFWDRDDALSVVMDKQLTEKEGKMGYIYVVSFHGSPDKFKVGTSETHSKDDRFKKHRECYSGCELIYCKPVGNAKRVEQLIFTDFKDCHRQLKQPCPNCEQRHKEWLVVDKAELIARIEEWREWMDSIKERPYKKNGAFNIRASRSSPHRKSIRESIGASSPAPTPSKKGKGSPSVSLPIASSSDFEYSDDDSAAEFSDGNSSGSLESRLESFKIK
ncbi:hypothetical protein N7478_007632 [Penicillium angulare]|uniref:uncharacterized protein n=1 Tax=Penicillium angulare TaxID=116970 RepID=UPI00253FB915|nr:uncharacterized protein N7478_007632 [Penicillium angulare]KAJ5272507.1 hypothetical protein N7478_007632 [Penicillium angulare]